MTFEPGTNVCDIGSPHVQGVVRTSGEEVSEVHWSSFREQDWSEFQFIPNSKLLVWGSDAHQAALLHEGVYSPVPTVHAPGSIPGQDLNGRLSAQANEPLITEVRKGRERDVDLMGLFNQEGNNDQE